MQPPNDDGVPAETMQSTPYVPPEPTPAPFNIGAILDIAAVVLAIVGSLLPFISFPSDDQSEYTLPSSVLQFLRQALYSAFLNALPTVWFFSMLIIALVTIASIIGVHFRKLYIGQIILSVFAIFWGLMTIVTFTEPHRFNDDVDFLPNWGFFLYLLAFLLSTIAGIISIRWSERIQQRDLVKLLKIP